jgi:hypothetical protein
MTPAEYKALRFADQLKAEQERLGLRDPEMAALLSISPRTYAHWKTDRPPIEVAQEGALARCKRARKRAKAEGVLAEPKLEDSVEP